MKTKFNDKEFKEYVKARLREQRIAKGYRVFSKSDVWKVLDIHYKRPLVKPKTIAEKFGCHRTYIYNIISGKFKHDDWVEYHIHHNLPIPERKILGPHKKKRKKRKCKKNRSRTSRSSTRKQVD